MSVRELVVLGTSSQIPTLKRNQNGYVLRWDEEGLLFDPGEGTQRQMIYAEVTATSISKILVTHFHGDHCLGLAGMTQRLSLDRVPHPVDVYFPASGQIFYDRLRRASIFHAAATMVPHPIQEAGLLYEDKKITIRAERLDHTVETFGYRLQERDSRTMLKDKLDEAGVKGRAIGELQRQGFIEVGAKTVRLDDVSIHKPGQSVAFVMDTRPCQAAVDLSKGAELMVCESTFLDEDKEEAHKTGHMTAKQAATIAKEAGAKQLLLTHFSHRYKDMTPFLEEAKPIFENTLIAEDGQRVPIARRKRV